MKKILIVILLLLILSATGCAKEFATFASELDDAQYVYPDVKI